MQINGGVRFCEQGMKASIRAMHVQSELIGMINENVAGFDKVIFTVATTLLTASNGTNSIHAESGVTESIGGSGSTVIKYEVIM